MINTANVEYESGILDILMVEDNPGDARLAREALRNGKIRNNLVVVEDGIEAFSYLHSEGRFRQCPLPGLILLDLNLPQKDGHEILAAIHADPVLNQIPVVILISSDSEKDILRSHRLHADAFITKPVDCGQFIEAVMTLGDFSVTMVKKYCESSIERT